MAQVPDSRQFLFDFDRAWAGPWWQRLAVLLVAAFALWHLATILFITESERWQNCIHFAGFALLAAWSQPLLQRRGWQWLDLLYGLALFAASLWVAGAEIPLIERTLLRTQAWQFGPLDWLAGGLVILAAVDLSRRLTGWIIPALVLFALCYLLFIGEWVGGVFRTASLPLSDVLFRSLYNDEGMFGIIASISSSNITLFMLFGAFLVVSGAADFVIEASKLIAGRFRGGAAFVAVLSSALTGTISGSAIANTASTGVITIPLMKANGFKPTFAAGVEAAASTGGQLMPPIMGAGAFVMVAYTGISYGQIVAVSIVPAILYFLSVAFIVRIEAMKHAIGSEPVGAIDRQRLRAGALNFLLPLAVMTALLVSGLTASYAACVAIASVVLISWLTPNRMTLRRILQALVMGIGTSVMTAVLLIAVGLINNVVVTSGLGNAFALMIAQWSQGSLLLAIVLVALASLVLGMGLPVTAAYIVLSILTAPALAGLLADGIIAQQLAAGLADPVKAAPFLLVDHPLAAQVSSGMTLAEARSLLAAIPFELAVILRPALVDSVQMTQFLLIAHLIVFWLSQDSNVTPPVCLAAFTAAGIAKSPPMATGLAAWRIAKGLYILPLMFAYTPLIGGELAEVLRIGFFALFGIYATNALIQRYAEGPLSPLLYPLLILGAVGSYWPLSWPINLLGAACVLGAILLSIRAKPVAAGSATA